MRGHPPSQPPLGYPQRARALTHFLHTVHPGRGGGRRGRGSGGGRRGCAWPPTTSTPNARALLPTFSTLCIQEEEEEEEKEEEEEEDDEEEEEDAEDVRGHPPSQPPLGYPQRARALTHFLHTAHPGGRGGRRRGGGRRGCAWPPTTSTPYARALSPTFSTLCIQEEEEEEEDDDDGDYGDDE